jgi:hypothetical protein
MQIAVTFELRYTETVNQRGELKPSHPRETVRGLVRRVTGTQVGGIWR